MKNFMSVGNAPIEINLNEHSTTLVTATNGSGKSSVMLDSITFALYGKAYRNINKPNLINSINQKHCLVEIWFKVNNTRFHIKRGIRPHVFEIYKNDELLNQDANIKDYQRTIEQQILRMNYRTFTQVVIMGSGNYIPFMRLPAAQRREFIEDLLDIKIFSVMNNILRDKISATKDLLRDLESEIKSTDDKIKMQQSFIYTLQEEKNT
jgi:DNA repair exonuclease SbcCD ATPase subunit